MRVLVACEFTGAVRDAFRRLGHEAWSNDLEDVEPEGEFKNYHFFGDCREIIPAYGPWDLLIAHPPCTHLSVSGARWFKEKQQEQAEALEFVRWLLAAPVPRIALENPVSIISSRIRKPDQIVHPWHFGHPESKATCWWLKNLQKLRPTKIIPSNFHKQSCFRAPPSPTRGRDRSRFYPGMAAAMAEQWGNL